MPSFVMRTISLSPLVSFASIRQSSCFDLDGDDAAFADVAVIGEIRFLHDAGAGRENDVEIFVPGFVDGVRARARLLRLNANGRGDFFVGAQLEQVGDATAFGGAAHLGNFVNVLDVSAARCP